MNNHLKVLPQLNRKFDPLTDIRLNKLSTNQQLAKTLKSLNNESNDIRLNESSTKQQLTKTLKSLNNECERIINSIDQRLKRQIVNRDQNLKTNLTDQNKLDDPLKFNWQSIVNKDQNLKTNLTDKNELDDLLKFELNWQLRNKLNTILNDFIFLLYSDTNSKNEKIIEITNYLISNLVNLPLKSYDIQDDITNSTDNKLIKPILILDSKLRSEITNLLVKNKYCSIQLKDKIDNDARLNLINENTDMIFKLLKVPIQMVKVEASIDDNFTWIKKSNQKPNQELNQVEASTVDDFNLAKEPNQKSKQKPNQKLNQESNQNIKIDKFSVFRKKFEDQLKDCKISKELKFNPFYEVNFTYELENFSNFINSHYEYYSHHSKSFNCLGIDWHLRIIKNKRKFAIRLIPTIDLNVIEILNKTIWVDCKLEIIDQTGLRDNLISYLNCEFPTDNILDTQFDDYSIDYLKNNWFTINNKLVLMLRMNAGW